MSPPKIGSEVTVARRGKITRYNNDNTANVKFDDGPGRPHKLSFDDINPFSGAGSEPEAKKKGWLLGGGIIAAGALEVYGGVFHKLGEYLVEFLKPWVLKIVDYIGSMI